MSTKIHVNRETRTKLARSLSAFLRDRVGFTLKHVHATQAIAHLFGMNEHSLAAAMATSQIIVALDDADQSIESGVGTCSVPGCERAAYVAVYLYDIYRDGQIFEEQDVTCPFLCTLHMAQNEAEASGERRPRGFVDYPFTNQHDAQGFSIYRHLSSSAGKERTMQDTHQLRSRDGRNLEECIADLPAKIVWREGNAFGVTIGALATEIVIRLIAHGKRVDFSTNYLIHTPVQAGPYRTSRSYNDSADHALRQAISGMTQFYDAAVREGYQPKEEWLVRA